MPPKISKHGGPSYEEPNVKLSRPSLMPGATDRKGGESSSHGSNSSPSEKALEQSESNEKANLQQPAPTTESPSSQTEKETSGADSTDGPTRETETGFGDEFDPNEVEPPKATPAKRTTRKTANTRSLTTDDFD